jgi:hypothetical protein
MADHPGLDDDATVGGEQTAAGERPGPPLLAVVESGPTPRRTSLMKLSRAASIADAPQSGSRIRWSLLTGVSRVFLYGWCRKGP